MLPSGNPFSLPLLSPSAPQNISSQSYSDYIEVSKKYAVLSFEAYHIARNEQSSNT
jgi:hypothetical protein